MSIRPTTMAERQAALQAVFLHHPRFKWALKKLNSIGSRVTHEGDVLPGVARVVVGEAGAGKTRLLETVLQEKWAKADLEGDSGDRRPALYVEVPPKVQPRGLVMAVLRALGEPAFKSWTTEDGVEQLAHIFQGVGVRVLLLDEAHWLMKSKSFSVRDENAEIVKSLMNRIGLHIVIAGTAEVDEFHRHFHGQMRRRLLTKVYLQPYNWSRRGERLQFRSILRCYEEAIGYAVPSHIWERDLASRIYLVSRGELGVVVQYLTCAIELIEEGQGASISPEILAEVHRGLSADRALQVGGLDDDDDGASEDRDNPFTCGAATLRRLWDERFRSSVDISRQTRLGPGGKRSG